MIEPALADAGPDEKQRTTGLRTLLAWAYLQRAQLQKAAEVLRSVGRWSARAGTRMRCRTCGWPR